MNGLCFLYGVLTAVASIVIAEVYGAGAGVLTFCGCWVVGLLVVKEITR